MKLAYGLCLHLRHGTHLWGRTIIWMWLQVSGITTLLVDLRVGLKKIRTTILEPAEQQSEVSPTEREALDRMSAFHRDSRQLFSELEVGPGRHSQH